MEDFTITKAKAVQERQLNEWKKLLKPKVFEVLKLAVENASAKATDGYGIARGNTIDNILRNVVYKNF